MIFQKTTKSVQAHLSEFYRDLSLLAGKVFMPVTATAWCKARMKLKHTAFIELNEKLIVEELYSSELYERWKGHRLLGVDGSTLVLPDHESIREKFKEKFPANEKGVCKRSFRQCRISVLYDLLNEIGIQAKLEPLECGEHSLAKGHVDEAVKANDLLIFDRGYISLSLFAMIIGKKADFVCRLSTGSFKEAKDLFAKNKAGISQIVTLKAHSVSKSKMIKSGLPTSMKVRLVTVRLPTGELEVLATSLLDKNEYPTKLFKELYYKRWGIETYYGRLKGRLNLENFSGKTLESVYQDYHSCVFISNLESVLSHAAKEAGLLDNLANTQINKSVSFHALKDHALELIFSDVTGEELFERLLELMVMGRHSKRKKRKVDRLPESARKSLAFHKQRKKTVY